MMEISVKDNIAAARLQLMHERDAIINKAASMALNRTGRSARAEMVRAIRSEFRIKAANVRAGLKLSKAGRRKLEVILRVDLHADYYSHSKGRAMNLIDFVVGNSDTLLSRPGVRKRRQPKFRIRKAGGSVTVANAFAAKMASGKTLVLQRTGDTRYPVKEVSTIGIGQMFNTRRVNQRVVSFVNKRFPVEFQRAVDRVLAMDRNA